MLFCHGRRKLMVRGKQVNSRAAAAAGPQLRFLAAAGIARDAIAALYFPLPPSLLNTFQLFLG